MPYEAVVLLRSPIPRRRSMALMIEVKVMPSSGRQEWVLDKSGMLKCFVKSPPEDGKANAELIMVLAKAAGIPRGRIQIVTGATARKKLIKIEDDIDYATLLAKLGIELQDSLLK